MKIELAKPIIGEEIECGDILILDDNKSLLVVNNYGDEYPIMLIDLNNCSVYDSYNGVDRMVSLDGYIGSKKILQIIKAKDVKIKRV